MASGYPIQWSGNNDWSHPKEMKLGAQQVANAHRIAAERSVDPLALLNNMLQPWTFGFDRHLDMFNQLFDLRVKSTYPPYNIKTLPNDKAEIELAVAGFKKSEINIEYKENVITVSGEKEEENEATYAYKGIAGRTFLQRFAVSDDVVVNGAKLEDGFLTIALERIVPEAKKAKTISIE
jgi:molecular chaperone IbpA